MICHASLLRRSALCLTVLLAACTQFPELDETASPDARRAPYPDLVPVEDLRAQMSAPRATQDTAQSLQARVTRLRARAARLRGTVIDQTSRQRLEQKITIPPPQ